MANFNDLPKPVRERIYRLHLVRDKPIGINGHHKMVKYRPDPRRINISSRQSRQTPPLLTLSSKIDKEAAPFYYGSNHFVLKDFSDIQTLVNETWPRHRRLVCKITITWDHAATYANEAFSKLAMLRGLQELYIRVNEKEMVKMMLQRDRSIGYQQLDRVFKPTPQQQLAVLRFPGMIGLLKLSIPRVRFVKMVNKEGEKSGGPLRGGVLVTQVAAKIRGSADHAMAQRSDDGSFPFLSLSPELRNRIYDMLLRIRGPLQPSPQPPSSAPKKHAQRNDPPAPESALSLLAVNRQIHDEAVGIFYHNSTFVFNYTLHLHGFLQSLGSQRQSFVRDITVHYNDIKSGGMSMVDLTFALLRPLTGLRRLEVLMHGELAAKIRGRRGYCYLTGANPGLLPGMKALFQLREVTNIKVRDLMLEDELKTAKNDTAYPSFAEHSWKACVVKLGLVLEHFNSALAEAQQGIVNHELLEDNKWQMQDTFPTMASADLEASSEL